MNNLNLYGEIGYDIKAADVASALSSMNQAEPLQVNLFSAGGAYFEGMAIRSLIEAYQGEKTVLIQGLAASMATYIMLAADKIEAIEGSYIMIHNPSGGSFGDFRDMEKNADRLKSMQLDMATAYSKKMKCDTEKAVEMMNAETWMSANEALEIGLIDGIKQGELLNVAAVAKLNDSFLNESTPEPIRAMFNNKKDNTQMKADLIKALALDETAEDSAILSKVVALSGSLEQIKAQLVEKDELVKAMADKADSIQAELDGFKTEKMAFEAEKLVSSLVKEADLEVSAAIEEKLIARAKAYQVDNDEMRLEDMKMLIKAYGVKRGSTGEAKSDSRASFADKAKYDEQLNTKIDEIIVAKGYDPVRDFAKAKQEAEKQLKHIGDK